MPLCSFFESTLRSVLALEWLVACFCCASVVMHRRSDWRHIGRFWPLKRNARVARMIYVVSNLNPLVDQSINLLIFFFEENRLNYGRRGPGYLIDKKKLWRTSEGTLGMEIFLVSRYFSIPLLNTSSTVRQFPRLHSFQFFHYSSNT